MKGLFSKKNKTRLYYIEINDENIDQEITKELISIEDKIKTFKININNTTLEDKQQYLLTFYKEIIIIKNKLSIIQQDIQTIKNIELKNKTYFIIKDKSFLEDKINQLNKILPLVDEFIEINEQHPFTTELKKELINKLIEHLNGMIQAIEKIIGDDKYLQLIYKKISNI